MNDQAWSAFEYETEMFYETRKWLRETGPRLNLHLRNALIESALLHTRILVDALLERGGQADDITLKELLPPDKRSADLTTVLEDIRKAYGGRDDPKSPYSTLNKRLAHLTQVRADTYDYTSIFNGLHPPIETALHEITRITDRPRLRSIQDLSAQRLDEWLHDEPR